MDLRCPTCRAPWRGVATCGRCGTDLTMLMRIAARAWELREAARQALSKDDRVSDAVVFAHTACRLHATPQGQRLLALALLANGQAAEAYEVMARVLLEEDPRREDRGG
jgi:hypothetical protein